jgi:hypothetical protein
MDLCGIGPVATTPCAPAEVLNYGGRKVLEGEELAKGHWEREADMGKGKGSSF